MLTTLAISNYRSLRDIVVGLSQLNVVTGGNGSGKSSLYRALRLLADATRGGIVSSLAREGGLPSTLFAGPDLSDRMRRGEVPIEGTVNTEPAALRLGFATDDLGLAVDVGFPIPIPGGSLFDLDPELKREVVFVGPSPRPAAIVVDRRGSLVTARAGRERVVLHDSLPSYESMFTEVADPTRAPALSSLRDGVRALRFYDHLRTDPDAPARASAVGTRTPVLAHDGRDLAAAWRTIQEIGDAHGLAESLDDAFPGARAEVHADGPRFVLELQQPGMLRPLVPAELSDGTLRYLMLLAALYSPRLPMLMVLNEPETSLHPDLLPPLARLCAATSTRCQLLVVSHARPFVSALAAMPDARSIDLVKELGETRVVGQRLIDRPPWVWPAR